MQLAMARVMTAAVVEVAMGVTEVLQQLRMRLLLRSLS
jgi:hypothetical protein